MDSALLAGVVSLLVICGTCILFGLYRRSTFRNPTRRAVGPPTKIGIIFQVFNFLGDEIYRPIMKRPPIKWTPKWFESRFVPSEVEQAITGPTSQNFYAGLEAICNSMNESNFTTTGHISSLSLVRLHTNVRKIVLMHLYEHMQKVARNEEKEYPPVVRPLIITGLPRTGSTLLFSLLAQDPKTRALRNWQMFKPLPPPTKDTVDCDPRIDYVRRTQKLVELIQPNFNKEFWKLHYYEAGAIEEELLIMMPHLMFFTHCIIFRPESEFTKWFMNPEGKEFVYIFIRKFLELMGSKNTPESHWVTKAPIHSFFPGQLMKAFPDACVVVPHRDPEEVVPSWTKLAVYTHAHYYDEHDTRFSFEPRMLCMNTATQMADAANRFMEYREKTPEKSSQFIDIYYSQLISDPIGTVRRIYEYFGYEYSEQFETNMKQWIRDNQQGKFGRVKYSLEEFDVKPEEVRQLFHSYLEKHPLCKMGQ